MTDDRLGVGPVGIAVEAGRIVVRRGASEWLQSPSPVAVRYLSGGSAAVPYDSVHRAADGSMSGSWSTVAPDGTRLMIDDRWEATCDRADRPGATIDRQVRVGTPGGATTGPAIPRQDGFSVGLSLGLAGDAHAIRRFAPGMLAAPALRAEETASAFADDRLGYPMVLAWDPASLHATVLLRESLPTDDEAPLRSPGDARFLHRTDIGSLGFVREATAEDSDELGLEAWWPARERGRSSALGPDGVAPEAFHPLAPGMTMRLRYRLLDIAAQDLPEAARVAFEACLDLAGTQVPTLPFSLDEAIAMRLGLLARTWTTWPDGGAGFVLDFDPERGLDAPARGFGASFADLDLPRGQSILEYGFTGRQIEVGTSLAEALGGEWVVRSAAVADWYVRHLVLPSGWSFGHYDIERGRPLFACGDPDGPFMHYLGPAERPGTFLRLQVEAMTDLLRASRVHRAMGTPHEAWLDACRRFAELLVSIQGPDGAWVRAYAPDGMPLLGGWLGATPAEASSATPIPVPFLIAMADELPAEREHYLGAARRAGRHVLSTHVASDEYRGGTLDNPNDVDKEAAGFAMRALLALYRVDGDAAWLEGARRAADMFLTWNVIWRVPTRPGTRLGKAGFDPVGWGGINSTWGCGVVDIYSLFFLADLIEVGDRAGVPVMRRVAELVAHGTQGLLSHPGRSFGFALEGMQPEGVALADQGCDVGLIHKGDLWGGLGWIHTAGTSALREAMGALARTHPGPGVTHEEVRS